MVFSVQWRGGNSQPHWLLNDTVIAYFASHNINLTINHYTTFAALIELAYTQHIQDKLTATRNIKISCSKLTPLALSCSVCVSFIVKTA